MKVYIEVDFPNNHIFPEKFDCKDGWDLGKCAGCPFVTFLGQDEPHCFLNPGGEKCPFYKQERALLKVCHLEG